MRIKQTEQYLKHYLSESDRGRKQLKHQDHIPYGPSIPEKLDITLGKQELCFIHGGYWQSFSSIDFACISEVSH